MRLIIDAGSTKMEWILMDGNVVKQRFYTEGFNPNYAERQCLENIIHLVETRFIASPNDGLLFSRRDKSASLQAPAAATNRIAKSSRRSFKVVFLRPISTSPTT